MTYKYRTMDLSYGWWHSQIGDVSKLIVFAGLKVIKGECKGEGK